MSLFNRDHGEGLLRAAAEGVQHRIREHLKAHLMKEAEAFIEKAIDEACGDVQVTIKRNLSVSDFRDTIHFIVTKEGFNAKANASDRR